MAGKAISGKLRTGAAPGARRRRRPRPARPGARRPSAVAVERAQRRLERERAGDDVERVEQARADRAGRDQREEGQRQREQHRQQRGDAHLPRQRAQRRAERGEGQRARRRARAAGSSSATKIRMTASCSSVTTSAAAAASTIFSASSALAESSRRSRAYTPSSRSSASSAAASSTRDEHQRQRRRDGDRELVQRRLGAADDGLLDPHGLADRVQDRLAQVEVVGGEPGEAADLLQRRPLGRVLRQPAQRGVDQRARVAQPEDLDLADERERQLRRP